MRVDVGTTALTAIRWGNSALSAGIITLDTPLAASASINLSFLFGVEQNGSYTFFVNVEAMP
jgi:hypothetical protein